MKNFPLPLTEKTQVQVRLAGWRLWDGTGGEGREGLRGHGGAEEGDMGSEKGRRRERGGDVRWQCSGDPLLPASLPASGVPKVGIVLQVHKIVHWKRPGVGQEEATCVGVSRVVAAH